MDKNELLLLAVKKKPRKDKVLTIKVDEAAYEKLKKRGYDIAKTVQSLLERLAE
jgi:hypothetical protein